MVEIPDLGYWKRQVRCQDACPVHTDARGYVRAIAEGHDELAYLIARAPNPLASICGRVCGAPCEQACRRGDIDRPVAIRALKRFVCSQHGPEIRGGEGLLEFLKDAARRHGPRECQGREDLLGLLQALLSDSVQPLPEGTSVGIIGSGPAGLACAHDLAILGAKVTIYEMEKVLAGMLALGIPEYRLPRDLIQAEVDVITRGLGVEAVTGCQVGRDVSLAELRARHDAVVIAIGAKRSRRLPIPGADAIGVHGGVDFLRDVAVGEAPTLGERVVVIGGGNVAYDVGRTVVRQTSVDAARTALRRGVAQTFLCSLESLEEMPADDVEIIEGDEEGIIRHNSLGPVEIRTDERGHVNAVVFQRCLRVFDENRRFAPLFDANDRTTIECDTVILSVGQSPDLSFVDAVRDGLELSERGLLRCEPESGTTSAPDVYVAGDLARGPGLLIHAVASGKAVARSIYAQITGKSLAARDTEVHFALPGYRREIAYEHVPRQELHAMSAAERVRSQSAVVETGFDETAARLEASRCLDCGVNTIFNGDLCILCGGCVDVCPELCLRIVPLDAVTLEGATVGAGVASGESNGSNGECAALTSTLAAEEGIPLDDLINSSSAILKDETSCIRCALCAERCPSGAITMERFLFREEPYCVEEARGAATGEVR